MPHVRVLYKMFLASGYRRRPRNRSFLIYLRPTSESCSVENSTYTPSGNRLEPYNLNGEGNAQILFWSVTENVPGYRPPPAPRGYILRPEFSSQGALEPPTIQVNDLSLDITAWYFPISGPAVPGDGSAIIVDAFSMNLGLPIDDEFVDVTSDPTLTNDANVNGIVPTNVAEILRARNSVTDSTDEPFTYWLLNYDFMPIGNATLNIDKGKTGIAIAFYQQPQWKEERFRLIDFLYRLPWPFPWEIHPEFAERIRELFREEIERLKKEPSKK